MNRTDLAHTLERQSVLLMEATLPADMTIAEWRRTRTRRYPRARHDGLMQRLTFGRTS
jgi:hypothetical protein